MAESETIELTGPAGNIVVNKCDADAYLTQGYSVKGEKPVRKKASKKASSSRD